MPTIRLKWQWLKLSMAILSLPFMGKILKICYNPVSMKEESVLMQHQHQYATKMYCNPKYTWSMSFWGEPRK